MKKLRVLIKQKLLSVFHNFSYILRLLFMVAQDRVGYVHGASGSAEVKRESGVNPELPRSGKQERKPEETTLERTCARGSLASRKMPAKSEDLP